MRPRYSTLGNLHVAAASINSLTPADIRKAKKTMNVAKELAEKTNATKMSALQVHTKFTKNYAWD